MEDFESIYEESENFKPSDEERSPLYKQLVDPSDKQEKEELIAKGGMKFVSKIYCSRTQRFVAKATLIKNNNPDLRDAFIREARLTALLDHPNIIKVHDIALDEKGEPYFTMELKTGSSLHHYKNEHHQKSDLLSIFIKICDAIAYAHSRRILHLDLKPENVQVGSFGEVVVCDWGLGKIMDREEERLQKEDEFNADMLNHCTLYGETRGTPGFMAPEQVQQGEKTVQTDIYGLGAILFSLLAPLRLKGKAQDQLLKESESGVPEDLYQKPYGIPNSLKAVIEKAMQSDPTCRYSSVSSLREDVQLYLNEYPTEAQEAGFFTQCHFLWKRNKRVCQVISLSLLIMACGLYFFMNQLSQSEKRALQALRESQAYAKDLRETMLANEDLEESMKTMSKTIVGRIFSRDQQYRNIHLLTSPKVSVERSNQYLEAAYETQPSNGYIVDSLAANYFISMDFLKLFKHYQSHPKELNYFRKFFEGRGFQNSTKDFSVFWEMVHYTQNKSTLMEHVIAYHAETFRQHPEFPKIISLLISKWAPSNTDVQLRREGESLVLDAPNLKEFRSKAIEKSLLRYLQFKELKVLASVIESAEEFEGLSLRKLDIRATKIQDLKPLLKLPELDHVKILKGQVPEDQVRKLSSHFKIEEEKVFEAEDAVFEQGARIMKDHHNFSGRGFLAGFYRNAKGIVKFKFPSKEATQIILTIKYSAGFGDALSEININGKNQDLLLPYTRSWKLWRTLELPIKLKQGENVISLKMKQDTTDCFNLDYLSYSHQREKVE
jgi:serine/threonine protein kinase